MNKFTTFIYKLFFTRDDDLDILQILFTLIILSAIWISLYVLIIPVESQVQIEALITLRWLAGLLFITAVPKWLVPFIKPQRGNNND